MTLRFLCPIFISIAIFMLCGCSAKTGREFPMEALSEGDILFRKGNSSKTRAVLMADTEGIYSHVGIAVTTDSGWMVVHITPGERREGETEDFIKMERIAHFFSPELASKGAFARFRDSAHCSQEAAKLAKALFEKKITFDHNYDWTDSSKMYCTELLWYAFQTAGRDITNGRRSEIRGFPLYSGEYIFPSDILKNEQLMIYYCF